MTNTLIRVNKDTAALNTAVLEAVTRLENDTSVRSIRLSDVLGNLASAGVRAQIFYDDRAVDRALQYLKESKKVEYLRKSEVIDDGLWGWVTVKTASKLRRGK